jgi:hypothetical protein
MKYKVEVLGFLQSCMLRRAHAQETNTSKGNVWRRMQSKDSLKEFACERKMYKSYNEMIE